jgi:hypothetical protein
MGKKTMLYWGTHILGNLHMRACLGSMRIHSSKKHNNGDTYWDFWQGFGRVLGISWEILLYQPTRVGVLHHQQAVQFQYGYVLWGHMLGY